MFSSFPIEVSHLDLIVDHGIYGHSDRILGQNFLRRDVEGNGAKVNNCNLEREFFKN